MPCMPRIAGHDAINVSLLAPLCLRSDLLGRIGTAHGNKDRLRHLPLVCCLNRHGILQAAPFVSRPQILSFTVSVNGASANEENLGTRTGYATCKRLPC